jgi:hypothetical protein
MCTGRLDLPLEGGPLRLGFDERSTHAHRRAFANQPVSSALRLRPCRVLKSGNFNLSQVITTLSHPASPCSRATRLANAGDCSVGLLPGTFSTTRTSLRQHRTSMFQHKSDKLRLRSAMVWKDWAPNHRAEGTTLFLAMRRALPREHLLVEKTAKICRHLGLLCLRAATP